MTHLWNDCSRLLESELTPQQFSAWIKPLKALDFDESTATLTICAPNRLKLDAIRSQFSEQIARRGIARDAASDFDRVRGRRRRYADRRCALSVRTAAPATMPTRYGRCASCCGSRRCPANEQLERARLNPNLTFDTFVTGKANQLARAAAMQVAENPGGSYNPLFLYGGVGLGKTHLTHAVGNAVLARARDAKVRYIHAEQYVSDVVRAYQRKAFDDFKRYYHSLDLLLIDDIQFFAGKARTQEEFFYAFEALVAGRKQIIITCDTYPKELKDMEDRLVSRFTSGLTVAIEPPELEMRVAILLKKAESEGAQMKEDVAFFIAKNLRSNVRELEGALRKVMAFSSFHGRAHHRRGGARGAQGPAVGVDRSGHGRADPEDRRRLLQDQGRRHVQQAAAERDRVAAPGRDVPGQGTDAEEPAGDRRAVRRPRPHDRTARGSQDQRRACQEPGNEPRPACSRADAQGLSNLWTETRIAVDRGGQLQRSLRRDPVKLSFSSTACTRMPTEGLSTTHAGSTSA